MRPAVFTLYPYPKQGGCFRQLSLAVKAAADNGYEVHYLSAKPFFPDAHPRTTFHRFPFYCGNEFLFYAVFYAISPLFIFFIAAKHKIKHFIVFNEEFAALCAPAAVLCKAKMTLLMQGSMEHLIKSKRLTAPAVFPLKSCGYIGIRAAGRVLAVSNDLANRSREYYGFKKPIGVFPNYPVLSEIAGSKALDLLREFNIPKGGFVIAYAGSLIPRKNIAYLLREFCASALPGKYLILAGDGGERACLEELAGSLGIGGSVIFAGSRDDRLDIVRSADLFILPSLHDDCPLALLEAICLGTPCLASRAGGIPEIMQYDELMFDPCLGGSLSERLDKIGRDKEYLRHMKSLCGEIRNGLEKDWAEEIKSLLPI